MNDLFDSARLYVFIVVCACLGACSKGRAIGDQDVGTPSPDVQFDAGQDVAVEVEPDVVDASPDITPDAGRDNALLAVGFRPQRAVYRPNTGVTPFATVYDSEADEAEVEAGEVVWTITPESGARENDDATWTLLREGRINFEGCVASRPGSDEQVCGSRSVIVDAGSPVITLFAPEPGAELLAEETPAIQIRGRVDDSNGELRVFVNGELVELSADGLFAAEMIPKLGVNHVDVVATDALNRLEATTGRDVLWANRYVPAQTDDDGNIQARAIDSVLVQINQRYLDADRDVIVPPEASLIVVEDIAGLIQFLLSNIDVRAFIPDPVVDSDVLQLSVTDVLIGEVIVDVDVTDNGLELFVSLPAIELLTAGQASILEEVLSLNGSVTAWISAVMTLEVRKERDEPLVVDVRRVELALEEAEPAFESAEADALFQLLESALFSSIEDVLLEEVAGSLLDEIPTLISGLLGSLDSALADQEIPLNLGFGEPLVLTVDGELATMTAVERDHLRATLDVVTGVPRASQFPDSRGVARSTRRDRTTSLFSLSRMQIAVAESLVNGVLHNLWSGGLLEIDVTELLPADLSFLVESVEVEGRLPPVLVPTQVGSVGYPLVLELGQVEMTLTRGDTTELVGATITLGASLDVVGTSLQIQLQEPPIVQTWLIDRTGDAIFEDVSTLSALFVGVVWPQLRDDLGGALTIALPALDVSAIADIATGVESVEMMLSLDNPVEVREGTAIIDGAFDAVIRFE
ncbi:MAG: hypothetical protein ACI81R_001253 [Bradymonadia bacterium]|jgi:hypothetical protein